MYGPEPSLVFCKMRADVIAANTLWSQIGRSVLRRRQRRRLRGKARRGAGDPARQL